MYCERFYISVKWNKWNIYFKENQYPRTKFIENSKKEKVMKAYGESTLNPEISVKKKAKENDIDYLDMSLKSFFFININLLRLRSRERQRRKKKKVLGL